MRSGSGALGALALSGCITVTDVADDGVLGGEPGYREIPDEPATEGRAPFIGLELEESLAGSLDALQFLAGLRVREVAPGSPAERGGIRAGDRVVRADGAELSQLDQWSARVSAAQAGEELALTIDRDGGLLDVKVVVGAREQASLPAPRRFLEGRKARCVVETDWSELDGERRPVARVVELADSSPLRRAGIAPGAALCALDGERLGGAADFARRVSRMPFGASIDLEWIDERGRHAAGLDLHRPERHFTEIRFWPLFGWEETPDESKGGWYLLDLWLIWLVRYGHEGEASELSILRFIRIESGAGALVEEPAVGAAPGASPGAPR